MLTHHLIKLICEKGFIVVVQAGVMSRKHHRRPPPKGGLLTGCLQALLCLALLATFIAAAWGEH